MNIPFIRRDPPIATDLFQIEIPTTATNNNRGYLREIAVHTVVGFIARTLSQSKFRHTVDGKRRYDDIDYMLNVEPNIGQSASEFWYRFAFKLYTENEVLVIFTDDGQMLVADSYSRTEYALVPDSFSSVVYKNYTYNRTFTGDNVLYLRLNNNNILTFMNQMFTDYTNLYNNMYVNQLRNNQLRGILNIDSNQAQDERSRNNIQELVNRIFRSFSEKAVSIVPLFKGFSYQEYSGGGTSVGTTSDLIGVGNSLIDEFASILGIPSGLLHGDVSNIDQLSKAYIKYFNNPLIKMIEDELNAKIIGKEDYMNGERIEIIGVKASDILENAAAIDKAISSSAFTANEIRLEAGREPSDDPNLDKHLLTKNYTSLEQEVVTTGGGDNNENN